MDYGTIFKALEPRLRYVEHQAHIEFVGTPRYFDERDLAIHREFEKFAIEFGIDPKCIAQFRVMPRTHALNYGFSHSLLLEPLFYFLPNAFNVRGVWTPECLKCS